VRRARPGRVIKRIGVMPAVTWPRRDRHSLGAGPSSLRANGYQDQKILKSRDIPQQLVLLSMKSVMKACALIGL
jgi:hypothetical protein